MKKTFVILLATTVMGISGGLYYDFNHEAIASTPVTTSQALPVQVVDITPRHVQIWKNFSGHIVAVDRVEIRPQVSGRINEIRFEDGQYVEQGDVLMVIDPRPYEAALGQAKASLSVAKAQLDLSQKEYTRAKALIKKQAISQSLLDERTHGYNEAVAAAKGAEAAVQIAQINLDYAYVKAPISGKVSRAEITEGNLVQSGSSAPLLTSVVDDRRVYVDFEVDERTYISSVKTVTATHDKIPVRLSLLDGGMEYKGVVHSFDNRINPSSGTIRARAIFQNEDKVLLPGMSVTVLLGGTGDQKKVLVTERAIGTDQDRKFVYIVNDEGAATYREVKVGESVDGQRVILSGLKEGETVITEGLVRIRPGMPVTPQYEDKRAVIDMTTDEQPTVIATENEGQ